MFYVTKINLLSIRYFHSLFSRFQQVLTLFLVWWCWLLCFSVLSFGWIAFFANNRALFVWRMCSTKQKRPVNLWNKKGNNYDGNKNVLKAGCHLAKRDPLFPILRSAFLLHSAGLSSFRSRTEF